MRIASNGKDHAKNKKLDLNDLAPKRITRPSNNNGMVGSEREWSICFGNYFMKTKLITGKVTELFLDYLEDYSTS